MNKIKKRFTHTGPPFLPSILRRGETLSISFSEAAFSVDCGSHETVSNPRKSDHWILMGGSSYKLSLHMIKKRKISRPVLELRMCSPSSPLFEILRKLYSMLGIWCPMELLIREHVNDIMVRIYLCSQRSRLEIPSLLKDRKLQSLFPYLSAPPSACTHRSR